MPTRTGLAEDPSDLLRRKIVAHFWRKPENLVNIEVYASYFDYYNTTCKALFLGLSFTELDSLSVKAHEDLLDIVDAIWELSNDSPDFDRPQVRGALKKIPVQSSQSISKMNNSINLLLRLWLTIRIQDSDFSPAAETVQWDDTSKISEFLVTGFPKPRTHSMDSGMPLETNFTAVNLYRMCGIRVEWTYQVEDHLKYDIENRTVSIYSLSQCLQDHLDSSSILPRGLAEETMLSLSILFPNWNIATEMFLRRTQNLQLHENLFEYPSYTHLDQFNHWRGRISRLHLEFQSPGPSLKHLWSDRRDRLQWYTFWFAVIILVVSVITAVLTAMQTVYAYQSLQLARKSV